MNDGDNDGASDVWVRIFFQFFCYCGRRWIVVNRIISRNFVVIGVFYDTGYSNFFGKLVILRLNIGK